MIITFVPVKICWWGGGSIFPINEQGRYELLYINRCKPENLRNDYNIFTYEAYRFDEFGNDNIATLDDQGRRIDQIDNNDMTTIKNEKFQ